ncbi:MAG: double-strand break repair protein AddB [Alphaproteobacteria bacterium]|nr:double-strand break repair protein AddB [Alphaproteobacteria bacterium]
MTGALPEPGLYSIAAHRPFLRELAAQILGASEHEGDPLALARTTILLPTRRACRSLQDTFLQLTDGAPLVLPRMVPIGDIDEDEVFLTGEESRLLGSDPEVPPAMPELRRRILLARILQAHPVADSEHMPIDHTTELAGELGRFLDQVQTERLDFDSLAALVPAEYAAHWQETLTFLHVLTDVWPDLLAAEGVIDAADRRNLLLSARADAWRREPPTDPVIAAGSTGSIPATADLLATVAGLPAGYVVLPGLDRVLDETSWSSLDPSHPQFGLRQLLLRLGAERAGVREWPGAHEPGTAGPARMRLVSEAMRPAATTEAWRGERGSIGAEALAGVRRIDACEPHEEAGAVALVLREVLETPGRTGALVTPDRALARRVASILGRWGVDIDDSAGTPLADTPTGIFLRLVVALVHEGAAPVPLLAALKHPLASGGQATVAFRARVRDLERVILRGPRPARGFEGLRRTAERTAYRAAKHGWTGPQDLEKLPDILVMIDGLAGIAAPMTEVMDQANADLSDIVQAHIGLCEALAASAEETGATRLWAGEAGEALATFVAELLEAGPALGPVPPGRYAALFDALLAGRVVRPRFGAHPRLSILGPLEARLQHFDVVVLGGLNEGSWPPEADVDPWMGRTMRSDFGLPSPERRIGLSAHDFAQAFCAERVVLSRSERVDGAPNMPSRWLTRLDVAADALGLKAAREDEQQARSYLHWWRALDGPRLDQVTDGKAVRPRPAPPVSARPRQLSVTQIETWMRDPYAIYAREILKLRALPPLDQNADAAIYGQLIHGVLDGFLAESAVGPLPADARERLITRGTEALSPYRSLPSVWTFWWPRFERIADWFLSVETLRRASLKRTHTEITGSLTFDAPAGPFRLSARADRIDELVDGGLAVIDLKTGAPPSKREVMAGFAPQLPLEAVIVGAGGFADVPAGEVSELAFWRLSGGRDPGQVRDAADDPAAVAAEAYAGLKALVARFDDPATVYEARPRPDRAPVYSDYEHLARVREWSSGGDPGGETDGGGDA